MAVRIQATLPPREAVHFLAGLMEVDRTQVRADLEAGRPALAVTCGLLAGRIRYERRDPNEQWLTRNQVLQGRQGDCEDLAAAVAAELHEAYFANGWMGASTKPIPTLPRPPSSPDSWLSTYSDETHYGPQPVVYKARPGLFHVVVQVPGIGLVDPSVAGGMRRE